MNVSKCVSGAGSWCRGLMKRDISPVHIVKRCPLLTSDFQLTASPVPPPLPKSDFPDELQ